jgi:hypothetical protein
LELLNVLLEPAPPVHGPLLLELLDVLPPPEPLETIMLPPHATKATTVMETIPDEKSRLLVLI